MALTCILYTFRPIDPAHGHGRPGTHPQIVCQAQSLRNAYEWYSLGNHGHSVLEYSGLRCVSKTYFGRSEQEKRHNIPSREATVTHSSCISLSLTLSFITLRFLLLSYSLVEMLNVAYSVSLLMEFAAFVKFRMDEDEDDEKTEGFRLPFNTFGCILFIIPPCLVCMFIIMTASKMTYVYVAALIVFGAGFHWMQKVAKHYNWWEYAQASVSKRASKYLAKAKLSVD